MNHASSKFALLLVAFLAFGFGSVFAGEQDCDWCKFSNCLVKAVQSDNEGVRLCAVRLIIRHADKVDVVQARYAIMDMFLNDKDRNVRRLAMVALNAIHHPLDMGLLERQLTFEEDPVIKKHLAAILYEDGRLPASYANEQERYAGK